MEGGQILLLFWLFAVVGCCVLLLFLFVCLGLLLFCFLLFLGGGGGGWCCYIESQTDIAPLKIVVLLRKFRPFTESLPDFVIIGREAARANTGERCEAGPVFVGSRFNNTADSNMAASKRGNARLAVEGGLISVHASS